MQRASTTGGSRHPAPRGRRGRPAARPRRARSRSVASRVRPVAGSSRGARRQPPSTTIRTPGTVSEVSAIEVASTTRRPSAGRSARSCSAGGRSPCSGSTSAPQPSSAAWVRRISAMPGRNARMSPSCSASAARTARAIASGSSRGPGMSRAAWRTSTGNMRPALSITSASSSPASRRAIGGGRHRDQPQFRPQHALQVAAQRQRQVGLQRALVHLVEDHGGDAVEPRIGLQPADQQPLGDHLDPGRRRDGGVQPGAIADRAADRLAQQRRPCARRRRGWRAGAAPASGCGRRRATARRAGPAGPASSCRRLAAPPAPHCARAASVREQRRDGVGDGQCRATCWRSGGILRHMRTNADVRGHPCRSLLSSASVAVAACMAGPVPAAAWRALRPPARAPRSRWSPTSTRSRRAGRSASACGCGWRPAGTPIGRTPAMPACRRSWT